jgi:hypothetical protein
MNIRLFLGVGLAFQVGQIFLSQWGVSWVMVDIAGVAADRLLAFLSLSLDVIWFYWCKFDQISIQLAFVNFLSLLLGLLMRCIMFA